MNQETSNVSGAAVACSAIVSRLRDNELYVDACDEAADTLERLWAENEKLRGIIARNALQRLRGESSPQMYVTADDIKESLEILYACIRLVREHDL